MEDMTLFWLFAALFFLLAEMGHPGLFFFLSFFFGAMASMVASMLGSSLVMQTWLFFGATVVAFIILKLWVKQTTRHGRTTNVQALVGKQGIVLKPITAESTGLVKVGGETWSARSVHNTPIQAGTVEVVSVTGAHLIVKQIS